MVRSDRGKKVVILLLVLVAAASVLASLAVFSVGGRSAERVLRADPSDVEANTVTLSVSEWEKFTYVNAPAFTETTFDGADALYYELPTAAETQYAMTASLTSPELDVYDRDYTLGFRFFTRQRAATPNVLSVLTSPDGFTYTESDRFSCTDSGSDLENWRSGELHVDGNARYLRLLFTVYYTGTGAEKIENGGLYLDEEITLTALAAGGLKASDFSLSFEDTEFYYNNEEQRPAYTLQANTRLPYYTVEEVLQEGEKVTPKDAGDYVFRVSVYDDANNFVTSEQTSFTIGKQSIDYLDSYETVANNKYVVLLDATFVDKAGREIPLEEAGCARIYPASSTLVITVGGKNFNSFIERRSIVPNASTTYLFYMKDKNVITTYTGEAQPLTDFITFFREYDFETETFTEVTASANVTYTAGEKTLDAAPKDAGEYGYVLEYGSGRFEGTLFIFPKEIASLRYEGTADIDKYYDGTTALSYDGVIVDALPAETVATDDVAAGDDVVVAMSKTEYARETGETYLVGSLAVLSGEDAANYVAAETLYVDATARIAPTGLIWSDLRAEDGSTVAFGRKVYDGTTALQIESDRTAALVMKGLGNGTVTYGDVAATTATATRGTQKVSFTLTNASLFDKYQPEIVTGTSATTEIEPYILTASASAYDGATKTYDGTPVVFPTITALAIRTEDMPVIEDGFAAAFATGEYEVDYERALFDGAEAGERLVIVEALTLKAYTREYEAIFDNYAVESITFVGEIYPAEITVLTENVRIYTGQALPDIATTSPDEDVITTTVYATREDAESQTDPLGDTTALSGTGNYFLRVGCSSANYLLTGNVILPLAVTTAEERADQFIRVAAFDQTMPYVRIPLGATLKLGAECVTATGEKTDVPVTVSRRSGIVELDGDVLTATEYADFSVVLTAEGNSYYKAASDVTLRFVVDNGSVTSEGTSPSGLFVGQELPAGEDVQATQTFYWNGTALNGTLVAREGRLAFGTQTYEYGFAAAEEYVVVEPGEEVSTRTYYTFDGSEYTPVPVGTTLTEDTYYALQRPFYGETTVSVELSAEKVPVTVTIGGTHEVEYGRAFDPTQAVTSVVVGGMRLTMAEIGENASGMALYRVRTQEGESNERVTGAGFERGSYVVYGESAEEDALVAVWEGGDEYEITITGSATYVVTKSAVTVYARNATKYYRSSDGSMEESRKALLAIEGNFMEKDRAEILANVTVSTAAAGNAGVGDYNIVPVGAGDPENYIVTYRNGYYTVVATPVTVFANPVGHVYGNEPATIQIGVSVGVSAGFDAQTIAEITTTLRSNTLPSADVSAESDAGSYPITFEYVGADHNFVITFAYSEYVVTPATITGVRFRSNRLLYDGERHTLAVEFDEGAEENTTVTYNYDYFVDVGIYEYHATVRKPNHRDLTLTANLTIGTLTLSGSKMGVNSVSVSFSKTEYETGLTPDLVPELTFTEYETMEENGKASLDEIISSAMNGKGYDVLGIYGVSFTKSGEAYSFGQGEYTVSFTPSAVNKSDDLILLGYGEDGEYRKLEYTYENGTFTVNTTSFENLVFVKERPEEINYLVLWISVAIAAIVVIAILAIVFGGGSKRRNARARSRRRHHRWA